MATAIKPGGAYLSADGKTWHDADGKVIASPIPAPVVVPKTVPSDKVKEPTNTKQTEK